MIDSKGPLKKRAFSYPGEILTGKSTDRPILYGELSQTGLGYDLANLLAYINGVAAGFTAGKFRIDTSKCEGIVIGMTQDFPYKDGVAASSPFKKIANFVAYFVVERPISSPFDENIIGPDLSKIENHQNGIIALQFAIDALHGAEILRKDGVKKLDNKINLSKHSFVDIVDALCSGITPSMHFKLLAVLFEQMAYKNNPCCQYDESAVS